MKLNFSAAASLIAICLVVLGCPRVADARAVRHWSYAELTKSADIVAIVILHESRDAKKPAHPFGPKHKDAVEVISELKPLVIFKGKEKDLDEILLLHYRMKKKPAQPILNGPNFATFQKKRRYLVFLKKFGNDTYQPVNGQMDPINSIKLLPY